MKFINFSKIDKDIILKFGFPYYINKKNIIINNKYKKYEKKIQKP